MDARDEMDLDYRFMQMVADERKNMETP